MDKFHAVNDLLVLDAEIDWNRGHMLLGKTIHLKQGFPKRRFDAGALKINPKRFGGDDEPLFMIGQDAPIQFMDADGGVTHVLGVADCGIGILASLQQNPAFADVQNDADAIALATELHITGTGDQHRGLGLDYVMNVVKDWGGDFCILSGGGYLNVKDGIETTGGNLNSRERISGTVVVVTLRVPATMR